MTLPPLIALPSPQIVEIDGEDAVAFAQAQFSSNLDELANGHWQWSAWLSAQGRVRAFFHLLRESDERLRLILRGGAASRLCAELSRYVFRAKVRLRPAGNRYAYIARHPEPPPSGYRESSKIESADGETRIVLPGVPSRQWLLSDTARADADDSPRARNENALADIDAGLLTLDPALEDRLLPAWIGLDALGAASANKGCYPGQEIVARLHFKGGNKRRLHRIAFPAETLPAPGTLFDETGGESALIVCSTWESAGTAAALAVSARSSPYE